MEGPCCCCPHLLSQSRGERGGGSGDEWGCPWSGPVGYGLG